MTLLLRYILQVFFVSEMQSILNVMLPNKMVLSLCLTMLCCFLKVSSAGAERLLRVPDDLHRFHDFPMVVSYVEDEEAKTEEKSGVFFIDSVEAETGNCVWKLADVKENRDPSSKGRPLSRKQRDWRLKLPYAVHRKVTLYLEF